LNLTEIIAAIQSLDPGDAPAILAAVAARLAQSKPPAVPAADSNSSPKLVDAATLAEALQLPKSWLMSMARQHLIPSVRAGKYVRFNIEAVAEALRQAAKE
jgi:hypothetical protein